MNPLIARPAFNEYFDVDDWHLVPVAPNDPSLGQRLELLPAGITRLTNDMIALHDAYYKPLLHDPLRYIQIRIQTMIQNSTASEALKRRVNDRTEIAVRVTKNRPSSNAGLIGANLKPQIEQRRFPLNDIVTDVYRRELGNDVEIKVLWPSDFPEDLISRLESADLQARYRRGVKRHLRTPEATFVNETLLRTEVEDILEDYARNPDARSTDRAIAQAYFRRVASLHLVEFRNSASQVKVSRVLHLKLDRPGDFDSLLIFTGEPPQTSVVPLPVSDRRNYIESSSLLRRLILQRLPLYEQLKSSNKKLAYYPRSTHGTLLSTITYHSPLESHATNDPFGALYTLHVDRLLADIDLLVSTDHERLADQQLEIAIAIVQALSTFVTLPIGIGTTGARMIAGFLLGQSAAALIAVRGQIADTPEEADALFLNAMFYSLFKIISPVVVNVIGPALADAVTPAVTHSVSEHLARTASFYALIPLHT